MPQVDFNLLIWPAARFIYGSLGAMLFMGRILPKIEESICIQSDTFVKSVEHSLRKVRLQGWKAHFLIDHIGNELTIKTKRSTQIPFDSAILHGIIRGDNFTYEIKPRRRILFLVPWYFLMFVGLVVSIVAALSSPNALIGVFGFGITIFTSWRNISMDYKKDMDLLQKIVQRNKKHST
jgi:hypothetical protein